MTLTRFALALLFALSPAAATASDRLPNIVFMMSDELAYYELSHMGNARIHTPRIDRMAREGIRFTRALAGAPVCAPLRCALMTGKHMGHASVRANDGGTPLRAEEQTIASVLKQKGYATGGFGKWGAGGRGSTGVPEEHGFDVFFGYYDQVHAHSFYTPYLIRNSEEVALAGNLGGRSGETYSHYEIMDEGLDFIRENAERPFFCYLPITPPHGMYDIPADDPAWRQYADDEWIRDGAVAQDVRNYAAMVTMVDNDLGRVLDLLDELGLEDDTIVFFTGDNGGQDRFRNGQHPRGFFGPNVDPRTGVEFRGGKGNLYEGGLRIPFLVRWPGKIEAGRVSDLCFYQPDVLPTLAELTGTTAPEDIDGLSILPELLGSEAAGRAQAEHDFLYWEYGSQTAVLRGDWKAIRPKKDGAWELYDLTKDPSETTDVSGRHPKILERMVADAARSHEPARPGTYSDRMRHERDRRAKWGTAGDPGRKQNPVHRLAAPELIPFGELTLVECSSENTANHRLAKYAFDGDPHTVWHSRWSDRTASHPHELVIDLGRRREVRGFHYLARQDSSWNGTFAETQFWVSDSLEDFGAPVLETTFAKVRKPQVAACETPVLGRYVRVRSLREVNGGVWGSAADIGVVAGEEAEVAGPRVRLVTPLGEVVIELATAQAPGTCANFLRYVDAGHYGGGRFHRTVTAQNQPDDEVKIAVVQGGVSRERRREGFPPIPLERTRDTGLRHVDGAISMARGGPDTGRSDFFFCVGPQPELDFGGRRNADGQGFAVFGRVVEGMDVVHAIHASAAQGQRLRPPIAISGARREAGSRSLRRR